MRLIARRFAAWGAPIIGAALLCAAPSGVFAAAPAAMQGAASSLDTSPQAGGQYRLSVVSYRDLPFRTVVRQQFDYSCGSAALATLLRYHFHRVVSEAQIFRAMYAVGDKPKIQKVGFSLLDMKRYLEGQGFTADGYRAPLTILSQTSTPAIAVVNVGRYKHFVVIKGVGGGQVLVGDPAQGLKVWREADFKQAWDGAFFVIHGGSYDPPVFNAAVEWNTVPHAPLAGALGQVKSISELTRDLPVTFQITPSFNWPVGALNEAPYPRIRFSFSQRRRRGRPAGHSP